MGNDRIEIEHTEDFAVDSLDDEGWTRAHTVVVTTYWSGQDAPADRHFSARLLWSDTALYARFEAGRSGPLIVSESPDLSSKAMDLWERDVCEIFVAPDREQPNRYYEFEIAPTGEWLDLAIEARSSQRVTDWEYRSNMESSARIENHRIVMAIKVPFESLGRSPKGGETWSGNIFRCVGKVPDRGYLAWRPTMTEQPLFHVPEAFGGFVFKDSGPSSR